MWVSNCGYERESKFKQVFVAVGRMDGERINQSTKVVSKYETRDLKI